jgi:hypoxanthine phosphoribosyltransferase
VGFRIERLFSEAQVRDRVAELAVRLWRDYADAPLTMIFIAEGARRFSEALLAELARRGASPPCREVRARRSQGSDLGPLELERFDLGELADRDVLVVDDVAEEGETLRAVLELATLGEPRSLRTAVLVDKPARRRKPLTLDYVGFTLDSGWVVGFGMDLDGAYRGLDFIGRVADERF